MLISNFGRHPMTTSLRSITTHCITRSVGNYLLTMMSNDDLNTFWEGLADEDEFWGEDEDDYIDDDGAVDDDKLELCMARQEAVDERKRKLLSTLMYFVELEDQEQRDFDSLDLRRHRERFRGLQRKKGISSIAMATKIRLGSISETKALGTSVSNKR